MRNFPKAETLNPVPSLEAYLSEAHRVLKPGGVRLTCVWKVGQLTRFRVQKFSATRVELMKACSSGLAVGRLGFTIKDLGLKGGGILGFGFRT